MIRPERLERYFDTSQSETEQMQAHLTAQSDFYRDHPREDVKPTICTECDGDGTTWACELPDRPHDPWDSLGCDALVPCPVCEATGVIQP